jgi:predicted ATP-dependent protease
VKNILKHNKTERTSCLKFVAQFCKKKFLNHIFYWAVTQIYFGANNKAIEWTQRACVKGLHVSETKGLEAFQHSFL